MRNSIVSLTLIGVVIATTPLLATANDEAICPYEPIDLQKYGGAPFQNPPELKSQNGSLNSSLTVQYSDPTQTTLAGCPLKLRTYNGQLVGPTLRVKPGDTINLALKNQLPKESARELKNQHHQDLQVGTTPNGFNTTNLHFHGLHVSPTGNSDNVLLAIQPQENFGYEVKLPKNHPPGAYWYHAHAHGSTAVQVGSGMSGAIVIEDDPATTPKSLLAANAHEKILVLQTILYNEIGQLDEISALFPGPQKPNKKDCSKKSGNFGTWTCSHRVITINGQITPVITAKRGEVQRWRITDSAFRESIYFAVEGHELNEIGLDGNYLGHLDTWKAGLPIDLEPGYRSDLLIKASNKPGDYKILDRSAPAAKTLLQDDEPEHVIGILRVTDETEDMALPTNAELAALKPFKDITPDEVTNKNNPQFAEFSIEGPANQAFQPNPRFMINYQEFDPKQARQLPLGKTQEWQISANGAPHVFHIHVNPFQVVRTGPDNQPETVWKDTWLLNPVTTDSKGNYLNAPTTIYTRYLDYIGQFVMHCHILDHEDLGMMEVEQVNN